MEDCTLWEIKDLHKDYDVVPHTKITQMGQSHSLK